MKRLLIAIVLLSAWANAFSQNIKTQVVVVGNSPAAISAAMQSALSGAKTSLVTNEMSFSVSGEENSKSWLVEHLNNSDNASSLNEALVKWMDTTKNLTIAKGVSWTKVERAGKGWSIKLKDGRTIKADVLVYAVKEDLAPAVTYKATTAATPLNYEDNLYRTSVAGFFKSNKAYIVSQYALIPESEENLVLANSDDANIEIGKAVGAIAAYGPFFGVKTSATKLKAVQGEMLAHKSEVIPLSDISLLDTNWRGIQSILHTGVLKPEVTENGANFNPDKIVLLSEITAPLRAYFYKAQIWLEDHETVPFTVKNAVDLMAYTRNKSPENTLKEVERKWNTSYNFAGDYSPEKLITRREFAAIALDYFQLDQVNVDKKGVVIR